jgi:hypothetical protein
MFDVFLSDWLSKKQLRNKDFGTGTEHCNYELKNSQWKRALGIDIESKTIKSSVKKVMAGQNNQPFKCLEKKEKSPWNTNNSVFAFCLALQL